MSSEMNMEELSIWLRTFESYREVSRLQYAPFSVQKAAFLQCIAVELQTKLDFSHAHDVVSYSPERFTRLYHDSCDTDLAYMLTQRHNEEEC